MRQQVFIYNCPHIIKRLDAMMIYCNKCGKPLTQPIKKLENPMFRIEVYHCRKCRVTYKEAHYNIDAV